MTNYIVRRLLLVPVLLFGVTVLIFIMLQFLSRLNEQRYIFAKSPRMREQLKELLSSMAWIDLV
jgi:ABC-type dipeptide/oligopeptide/nickel transport system permease component